MKSSATNDITPHVRQAIFFMARLFIAFAGIASISAVILGVLRNMLQIPVNGQLFLGWGDSENLLFYLSAGTILLVASLLFSTFKMPVGLIGGAAGLAVHVMFFWLTDLTIELDAGIIYQLPRYMIFFGASLVSTVLFDQSFLLSGNPYRWAMELGISWCAATPPVILGVLYARAADGSWLDFILAIIFSISFLVFCLSLGFSMLVIFAIAAD